MNRQEYEYCASAFRGLLHNLAEGDFRRRVKYRFGLQFNPMFGFYHLWDGANDPHPHTLATLKLRPKTVTIRHLPNFMFKEELLKFTLPERKSVFILSENVGRHDDWVHQRIQSRVERRMQQRASFLATEQNPFILNIQISPGTLVNGQMLPTTQRIRIQFDSEQDMIINAAIAERKVREILSWGQTFGDDEGITFAYLIELHRMLEQTVGQLQERQAMYQNQADYNIANNQYMGRVTGQIQSWMETTGVATYNEANIHAAVRAMDEANVPREVVDSSQELAAIWADSSDTTTVDRPSP